jgi:hypothetical protein
VPIVEPLEIDLAAVSALALALAIPADASACPCSEFCGPVVDHGTTLFGVPWRIAAVRPSAGVAGRPSATLHFSTGACGSYSDDGYSPRSICRSQPPSSSKAIRGSDTDSNPDRDISGETSRRVATLTATMSQGEPLNIHPTPAPKRLWRAFPWLRSVRVFETYFPAETEVVEITAFNRASRVLDRQKLRHGFFS